MSFIISGLHQILIYGPGRELADVQAAAAGTDLPPFWTAAAAGQLYWTDLVYRGPDPRVLQYLPLPPMTRSHRTRCQPGLPVSVLDRIESVNFKEPGRYLVVCGVRPHFDEGMHGYVNVKA